MHAQWQNYEEKQGNEHHRGQDSGYLFDGLMWGLGNIISWKPGGGYLDVFFTITL